MQVVEYQPHFWSEQIHTPMVLGAEPDHSQYYQWLQAGIFTFYHIHPFGPDNFNQLPTIDIHRYIRELDGYIEFHAETSFNKERLKVVIKVECDIISHSMYEDEAIERIFEILYRLIQELKRGMYLKSHYKEELDTLWTTQHNMMMSVNGVDAGYMDYIRDRLNVIQDKMNTDFERIIMGGDAGAAMLDNDMSMREELVQQAKEKGRKTAFVDGKEYAVFGTEEQMKPIPEKTEEEEFADIEAHLARSSKTLKLSRVAIKSLPKSVSNKFVLPLEMSKEGDFDKFKELKDQPFSFLEYNGAKFAMDLKADTKDSWDPMSDSIIWENGINSNFKIFDSIKTDMQRRKDRRTDRMQKLNKVYNKLDKHVDYLKAEFEKKVEKYGNDKYVQFVGSRTVANLTKIRESQKISKNKLFVLKNKRLHTAPEAFFDRMLKLYLGETGSDIRKDLDTLGYNTRYDSELGVIYLLFLLHLIDSNKGYNAPVLHLVDGNEFNIGYENLDMLKVMAGHMFIHTVTLKKV